MTIINDRQRRLAALRVFLRVYGVLTLIIFGLLFVGFMVQTPLLAEAWRRVELDDLERR